MNRAFAAPPVAIAIGLLFLSSLEVHAQIKRPELPQVTLPGTGTGTSEEPDNAAKLAESLQKWQKAKESCKGNYEYLVRKSSFSGMSWETDIVVRDNKVVERRHRVALRRMPLADQSWVEKGEQLGSHDNAPAPKLIDQLYTEASATLKKPLPRFQKRYLTFDKQGLLLSCYTRDTRIADDAPIQGVVITRIKLGAGEAGKVYRAPNGKAFPAHWGAPPRLQTRDLRPLPGGYGRGSGTLARWIQQNLDKDAAKKK